MIAEYLDRRFQLWEYHVSFGSLLIRSPRTDGDDPRPTIDLIFMGVEYVAVPHTLSGVTLEQGSPADHARAQEALGDVREHVFALTSEGKRHLVVASRYSVEESSRAREESPFSWAVARGVQWRPRVRLGGPR